MVYESNCAPGTCAAARGGPAKPKRVQVFQRPAPGAPLSTLCKAPYPDWPRGLGQATPFSLLRRPYSRADGGTYWARPRAARGPIFPLNKRRQRAQQGAVFDPSPSEARRRRMPRAERRGARARAAPLPTPPPASHIRSCFHGAARPALSPRPSLPRQACLQGCLPVSRLRSARRRLRSLHAHQADKPATGPATGTAVLSRGRPAPCEAPRLESTRHGAEPRRYIILHTHQKQGRGVGGRHQECASPVRRAIGFWEVGKESLKAGRIQPASHGQIRLSVTCPILASRRCAWCGPE